MRLLASEVRCARLSARSDSPRLTDCFRYSIRQQKSPLAVHKRAAHLCKVPSYFEPQTAGIEGEGSDCD